MTVEQIRKKLSGRTVGIAGCGGLGSNCAIALARVGVGTLILVDYDVVSEGNLNRQYYFQDQIGKKKVSALEENIQRVNPEISVRTKDLKIEPSNIISLFRDCEVIVEAFDLADQKEMLIETVLSVFPDKDLVIGLGMAGWGKNELIRYRKIDRMHICGDEISEVSDEMPPLAPRVGIVANIQANIVLQILLQE